MIPLLVIGAVLLLLVVLLLVPIKLQVSFREEFTAQVKFLFFRFPLASQEEPEESTAEEKPAGEKGPSSSSGLHKKLKGMLRREGLGGFLRSLKELAQTVETASVKLLKKVKLKKFDLYVCLGGKNDAAAAAVLYGQVSGVVYTACGILFGVFPCRKKSVTVDLDYSKEDYRIEFSGIASVRLLFFLKEGLILLYRLIPFFKKLQAKEDHRERISRTRKQGE